MYTQFYGFTEKPFSLTPDPAFLYLSKQHKMALTMLSYGLQSQAGITVISGEVGSGKTTLIREILRQLDKDINVGLISNAHNSFGNLLEWVLMAYNIKTEAKDKATLYKIFVEFLINEYANNKRTVLIIDEAQNMDMQTLEELRLLSNINADKHLVLQLVLIGQPELLETLQRHELRQLAQRVSVDYKLKQLGYKETKAYIRHRLKVANGDKDIFDKYAIAAIYYHTGGVPRLINTLCDFALVYGFAEDSKHIYLELMLDVIKDKQKGGVFPVISSENREQEAVRRLVKLEKGIDIVSDHSEEADDIITEL
jgi:type II secretory pathway predicted ATPase ExeA